MRLLHSDTLDFASFSDGNIPPYAILSHTWGADEVTFQQMQYLQKKRRLSEAFGKQIYYIAALEAAAGLDFTGTENHHPVVESGGYVKVSHTAQIARDKGLQYFWIDTCCIDKSSSAELQEAINSMYQWYRKSTYCIVHLEDQKYIKGFASGRSQLPGLLQWSRWLTRGWTLQELIAPRAVGFYDKSWMYLCDKSDALPDIEGVTRIPRYVLATGDLADSSVAQKMSWAAHRTTTRTEDIAYSLMGLFGIHMPMLYGEGEKAFQRLQEEIIKLTSDDSVFAWLSNDGGISTLRGMFARSPQEFKSCSVVTKGQGSFTLEANRGLHLYAPIQPFVQRNGLLPHRLFHAKLSAQSHDQPVVLILQMLDPVAAVDGHDEHYLFSAKEYISTQFQFARVFPHMFGFWPMDVPTRDIYIRATPIVPPELETSLMHCFHIRPSNISNDGPELHIARVWPSKQYSATDWTIGISEHAVESLAVIWLTTDTNISSSTSFFLFLGYDRQGQRPWCKLWEEKILESALESSVGTTTRLSEIMETSSWPEVMNASGFFHNRMRSSTATGIPSINFPINVRIETSLWQDQLSATVSVDGLQYRI